ncbi:MAG: hypothetical protein GF417_05490 [Candidatus Latescibacteria bacterium]|nr:hypothetical protein [bacterium]MBD3423868.1 hypothetical protein [Candidatus Latescibacterota bacterium]
MKKMKYCVAAFISLLMLTPASSLQAQDCQTSLQCVQPSGCESLGDWSNLYDGNTSTCFQTSYTNWQGIEIEFGCTVELYALRRYMTRDGSSTAGSRGWGQGERFHYYDVIDSTWVTLTGSNTSGWDSYWYQLNGYWNNWYVPYGWAPWQTLDTPAYTDRIRYYFDCSWVGESINEIEINYNPVVESEEQSWGSVKSIYH